MISLSLSIVVGQLLSAWLEVPWWAVVAASLGWIVGARLRHNGIEPALRCVAVAAFGAFLAGWAARPPTSCFLPEPGPSQKIWLEGEVVGSPTPWRDGLRFGLRARGGPGPVCGTLLLTLRGPTVALAPGHRIRVHAHLRRPRNFRNPGAYDFEGALARRGIWTTASGSSSTLVVLDRPPPRGSQRLGVARTRIGALIDGALPEAESGLLRALVVGDASRISPELRDRVARVGLAHLLSVSGLHIGIVWAAVYFVVHRLLGRSEWLLLHSNPRALAGLVAMVPAASYGALAGGRSPASRAVWMVLLPVIAVVAGREVGSFRVLAIAAAALALARPGSPLEISYQLSFVSVLALLAGGSRWTGKRSAGTRWRERLVLAIVVPASALAGSAPLVARYFNQVTPIGLLTNPVLVPLCGVPATLLGIGGAAISFVSDDLALRVFSLTRWPLAILREAAAFADQVPFGSIPVPTPTILEVGLAYGLLSLPWLARSRRGSALLALAVLLVFDAGFWIHERWLHPDLRIRFLDVGQGDSAVIELPKGQVLVVDGGGFPGSEFDVGERVIARYLRARRISRVDFLAASHGDWDHQGGLHFLAKAFSPVELWRGATLEEAARLFRLERTVGRGGGRVRSLRPGDVAYRRGDLTIECLHPPPGTRLGSNDSSLVLRLDFGRVSILLAGDIEAAGERLLGKRAVGRPVAVLKAPHHGSRTSSTPSFVAVVRPGNVVFSVGAGNRYGFPHREVLARYERVGARILRTDEAGAVGIRSDGVDVAVQTFGHGPSLVCRLLGALC